MKKKNSNRCYSFRTIQKKLKRNAALFAVLSRVLLILGNLVYLYLKRA